MKTNAIPIFIIGAARNGTTNLENTVASLPQVAGAEHWLHYGSCESNLYSQKRFWGDLSATDDYIDFLYRYSGYDYFQLCQGDLAYHLEHKRDNFYEFFFDLMDNYAAKTNKGYWITKLQPLLLTDKKEEEYFFSLLKKRYPEVKFIRIQRNFENAFKSYLRMEGKRYNARQNPLNYYFALFLQASRYVVTYQPIDSLKNEKIFEIKFEDYIKNRSDYLKEVMSYLKIEMEDSEIKGLDIDKYEINTSFVRKNKKKSTKRGKSAIRTFHFLESNPLLARLTWKVYVGLKPKAPHFFRRLMKYEFYREELLKELTHNQAQGLIQTIKSKEISTP